MPRFIVYDKTTGEVRAIHYIPASQSIDDHPIDESKFAKLMVDDQELKKIKEEATERVEYAPGKFRDVQVFKRRVNLATKGLELREKYKP